MCDADLRARRCDHGARRVERETLLRLNATLRRSTSDARPLHVDGRSASSGHVLTVPVFCVMLEKPTNAGLHVSRRSFVSLR